MSGLFKYQDKNRLIRIYRQRPIRWKNEYGQGQYLNKHYIHPKDKFVHACVQQIRASVYDDKTANIPADRFQFVIGYRKLDEGQYYIEFNNETYKVIEIDQYDMRKTEIKIVCQKISVDDTIYKKVSYERWD